MSRPFSRNVGNFTKIPDNRRIARRITRLVGEPTSARFRLARDTFGVMCLKGTSLGLGFLISVLLARTVGVASFGLYAFAWSFLILLSTPGALGFPQLLVREVATHRTKGAWEGVHRLIHFARRTAVLTSLGLVLLTGLGLWLFAKRLSSPTIMVLAVALPGLPLLALVQLHGAALRGLNRILEGQAVELLVPPLTFLLLFGGTWLLARELLNAPFAVGLQVVAVGVALLASGLLLRRHLARQATGNGKASSSTVWLRSALWLLLSELLYLIPQHAGVLLLGVMQTPEAVSLYKVAHQTASLIPFGLVAVNTAIAPTLAQLYASGAIRKLRRTMLLATGISLSFALPLVLFYLLAGAWLLKTLFGGAFSASADALSVIAIGQVINAAAGPVGLLLIMSGHERLATLSTGISAAVNIAFNLFLIPFYGVMGAAIATAVTHAIFNLLARYFVITRVLSLNTLPKHDR